MYKKSAQKSVHSEKKSSLAIDHCKTNSFFSTFRIKKKSIFLVSLISIRSTKKKFEILFWVGHRVKSYFKLLRNPFSIYDNDKLKWMLTWPTNDN